LADDFRLKMGLFLGGVLLLLGGTALVARWWGRLYREVEAGRAAVARRVLKNSLAPIVANLINKAIDFAFAIVVLHYLGVEGNGRYALAALLVGQYLTTVSDFGLGILTSREVARSPAVANRYLWNTTLLRWAVGGVTLLAIPGIVHLYRLTREPMHPQTVAAIWLLAASLFPAGVAASVSSLFTAYERMEVPAFAALLTNALKVFAGVGVLVAGWGVVGLAASALGVTLANAGLFLYLQHRLLFSPRPELDLGLCRWMLGEAFPLLLNNLLLLVFFRFDTFLLKPYHGDRAVGAYDAAYKFLNATTVLPAYLTIALFPLFSRYALQDRARLAQAYRLALKALLVLAFPTAMITSVWARELIVLVGGKEYLEAGSATALAILIWFLPLSYINGVTQYLLIALNRQRWITVAFLVASVANIAANWATIPRYGLTAASVITILTEGVLLLSFGRVVRRELGRLPLWEVGWRPAVAAVAMGLPMVGLYRLGYGLLGSLLGLAAYGAMLAALRMWSVEERAIFCEMLPARVAGWLRVGREGQEAKKESAGPSGRRS
jgi:O-antigen/teichoic acid export membrane protein